MSSRASLNHVYRTVWNQALGAMVAVAEISNSQVKGGGSAAAPAVGVVATSLPLAGLALAIAMAWGSGLTPALANPTGGVAVHGQATMVSTGNKLLVTTQNGVGTQHSAINWQSFSIPAASSTHFQQPHAGSTVINRVVTNTPSALFGTLSSNGHVVLVNQTGIAVGAGALVDTAGFTASALQMNDADALAGHLRFGSASAAAAGGVSVQGQVLARSGDVVLIGNQVDTGAQALVQAPNGSTVLVAGQQVALTGRGLEGINLQVQAPEHQAVNLGTLQGDAVGIFAGTLKHSGLIHATQANLEGGRVVLRAAADALVQGDARIQASGSRGGQVDVLGQRVAVTDNAAIDVSGAQAGGSVRVGGDYQGKNDAVPNAQITYFGQQASINANANAQGDGGKVIVWADDTTRAYGNISARGGEQGGNGGFVETSGKRYLDFQGRVDTRAPLGKAGTLLLDPQTLRIENTTDVNVTSLLNTFSPTDTGQDSVLQNSTLDFALQYANVLVDASGYSHPRIEVNAPVYWNSTQNLELRTNSAGGIVVNASISGSAGHLKLNTGADGITGAGAITTSGLEIVSAGNVNLPGLNSVGVIAANVSAGSFAFNNNLSSGLQINVVGSTFGVNASGDVVVKNGNGDLTVGFSVGTSSGARLELESGPTNALTIFSGEGVNAGTSGTVVLKAGSMGISGYGNVSAKELEVRSGGNVLLSGSNVVEILAADVSSGSLEYHNNRASGLKIGSVGTLHGVTVYGNVNVGNIGPLVLDKETKSNNGYIRVDAASGSITGAAKLVANDIWLQHKGGQGNIGASGAPVNTSAPGGTGITNLKIAHSDYLPGPSAAYISHLGDASFNHNTQGPVELHLETSGDLTTGDINYSGATTDVVLTAGGQLTLNSNASIYGKNVTLIADKIDLQSSSNVISGGGSGDLLWVQPKTSGTKIDIGSGVDSTNGTLELSKLEVGRLNAGAGGTLRFGCACSGTVHFSDDVDVTSISNILEVWSGAGVTQGTNYGAIQANKMLVKAAGSVDLDTATSLNGVPIIAGAINGGGSEHFKLKTSGSLQVGTLGGVSGISIANFAPYTPGSPNGVITLDATGGISQLATAGLGGAAVVAKSYGGAVDLTAASNATGIVAGTSYGNFSYRSANTLGLMDVDGTSGISISMYGDIVLDGTGFSNSLGSGPFSAGSGRWLVYLNSPVNVSKGVLLSDFREYGKVRGDTLVNATGNGFVYASTPGVLLVDTTRATGSTSHTYGATPDVVWGYAVANSSTADSEDFALTSGTPSYTPVISNATNAGSYLVKYQGGLSNSAGYTFAAGVGQNYTVNPVVVTPVYTTIGLTGSRMYDGTNIVNADIFTLSGLVGSETLTLTGAGTVADKNVGVNKPVSLGTLTLGNGTGLASNYTLSGGTHVATITPAPLSAKLTGYTFKTYDGTAEISLRANHFLVEGLKGQDSLWVSKGSGTLANKNVGKGISVSTNLVATDFVVANGTLLSNYTVPTSATGSIADVNPASVTVEGIKAQDKVYDGTKTATLTGGTLKGVVTGEAVTLDTLRGSFADKNVGTVKPVSISGLTLKGTGAGNYVLASTAVSATASISAKPLLVGGITVANKVYDATTTASVDLLGLTLDGLVAGDKVLVTATGAFSDKNVGKGKTVNLTSTYSGADFGNYKITDQTGATADITPALLTFAGLAAQSKVYDGTNKATLSGGTLSGVLSNDQVSIGTPTGAFADKNVGSAKPITVTGLNLTGADLLNYSLPSTDINLSASITAKPLTVQGVSADNKIYDGKLDATINTASATLAGLVAGDDVRIASAEGSFSDRNAGTGKTVNISKLTLTGDDAGNYASSATSSAKADIAVRPLSTWVASTGGDWGTAANWDALPDGSNVLAVSIPAGSGSVMYSGSGASTLQTLTSGRTINITGGSLQVSTLTTSGLLQSGGNLVVSGSASVRGEFTQTSGSLQAGSLFAQQGSGNLNVSGIKSSSITLIASASNITQTGPIEAAMLSTESVTGTILNHGGNRVSTWSGTNFGSGNIELTNTGVLSILGISNFGGGYRVFNTGGVETVGPIVASGGGVTIIANSPLTIGAAGVSSDGDVVLTATNLTSAGDITINGPVRSTSGSVGLSAANNMTQNSSVFGATGVTAAVGGTLTVAPTATSGASPVAYAVAGTPVTPPPVTVGGTTLPPDPVTPTPTPVPVPPTPVPDPVTPTPTPTPVPVPPTPVPPTPVPDPVVPTPTPIPEPPPLPSTTTLEAVVAQIAQVSTFLDNFEAVVAKPAQDRNATDKAKDKDKDKDAQKDKSGLVVEGEICVP